MNIKLQLSLLLLGSIIWMSSFQSCAPSNSSDVETITDMADSLKSKITSTVKKYSEMNVMEQTEYAAKHSEQLAFIDTKLTEISNEHVNRKDYFTFECESGKVSLERFYNDSDEIHLLNYTICKDDNCSTKSHAFWDGKLIYQNFHHAVKKGDQHLVDDHLTYFKDGNIIKCLERDFDYTNGEAHPNLPYKQVDCVPADKLTHNIEKLLTLSEEDAKAYLCK